MKELKLFNIIVEKMQLALLDIMLLHLWSSNLQIHPKFGSSHHNGIQNIISITYPA